MHRFGIFLLLCVSIGTIPPTILGGPLSQLLQTIVANAATEIENAICIYLGKNPTRAENALAAIENSLDQSNATKNTFVNTLNYLNSPTNQAELISNISTCLTFLNGLQNAIQTDLNDKKSSVSTTALNMWTTILNDLTALAG